MKPNLILKMRQKESGRRFLLLGTAALALAPAAARAQGVLDAGGMIERRLETSSLVVHRFDTAADRAPINMNIKDRQKNAHLRYISHALNFYNFAICRRNDNSRVRGDLAFRITKEKCHEGGER